MRFASEYLLDIFALFYGEYAPFVDNEGYIVRKMAQIGGPHKRICERGQVFNYFEKIELWNHHLA